MRETDDHQLHREALSAVPRSHTVPRLRRLVRGTKLARTSLAGELGVGQARSDSPVLIDGIIFIFQNCEKGAKRDLCDHLLAKTDGRVELPTPSDGTNVIKRQSCKRSQMF